MTDNEATRTTFVRTRPALHEGEAETGCYEVEAKNFDLEVTLASMDLTSLARIRNVVEILTVSD